MEGVAHEMKKLFAWANEIDLIFAIVCATFLLAFITLAILITRGGRSLETKAVLDAIDETRTQLGNVDSRIEQNHRFVGNWLRRLLARFGFLDDAAQSAVNDIKKRPRDDDGD
jgi:hypothetical protein